MRNVVRTVVALGASCVLLFAGCRSTSRAASVARPPARAVGVPHHSAEPTFIASIANGGVDVARVDDGKIVQVLAPAARSSVPRIAMREPNGGLLVKGCAPSCGNRAPDYRYAPYFRDAATGMTYPGDSAALSPDRSQIATLVSVAQNQQIIRQYDVATGRVVSDLLAGVDGGSGSVLGFAWTADSRSLVVAVAPRIGNPGGLYVADRTAHRLPSRPAVPNTVSGPFALTYVYASPAALANGHILAFQYRSPIQRTAWPGALVDIDLRTGTRHTVLGTTPSSGDLPACGATTSVTAAGHPCETFVPGASVAARGDQALVTIPEQSQIWLYNEHTVRLITTIPLITAANW